MYYLLKMAFVLTSWLLVLQWMLICLVSIRCVDYTYFRYHSTWHIANDGSHLFLQIIRHVMVDIAVLKKKEYMLGKVIEKQ